MLRSWRLSSQGGFHTREAIEKALVGAREAFFWLDVTPASHIHKREQQVAELFLSMLWITGGNRFLEFIQAPRAPCPKPPSCHPTQTPLWRLCARSSWLQPELVVRELSW